MDDGLSRILNSMERKLDGLDQKLDKVAESSMSRKEFHAFQDIRRSNIKWSIGTIVSVVMVAIAAIAYVSGLDGAAVAP